MNWDKQTIKKYLPYGIIGVALLVVFILIISKKGTTISPTKEASWPVNIIKLEKGTYAPYLILYGRIESPEMVERKARIEADITKVYVREGVEVKKGDPLVQLEDRELKLLLQQRQADVNDFEAQIAAEKRRNETDVQSLEHEKALVAIAQKNVGRREHLTKTLAGSELALDQAHEELNRRRLTVTQRENDIKDHQNRLAQLQAKLMKAKALFDLTNIELEKTLVTAPFDGRVTMLSVSTGDRVKTGDVLIQLYDSRFAEVRCQIPEQYVQRARDAVTRGDKITATTRINNKPYSLTLSRLAGRAERGRLGIDALFRFDESITDAVIGRTIPLKVDLLPVNNVFAVPVTSIFNGNQVFKIVDGRLLAATIKKIGVTDLKNTQYYLIQSQRLKEGDYIITTQLPNAITGLKVTIE